MLAPRLNTFFMLYLAEHEICPANKSQIINTCNFFLTKHSWAWNFSDTVGIFIFISGGNFMLSSVEHEKWFITSGLEEWFTVKVLIRPRVLRSLSWVCLHCLRRSVCPNTYRNGILNFIVLLYHSQIVVHCSLLQMAQCRIPVVQPISQKQHSAVTQDIHCRLM